MYVGGTFVQKAFCAGFIRCDEFRKLDTSWVFVTITAQTYFPFLFLYAGRCLRWSFLRCLVGFWCVI